MNATEHEPASIQVVLRRLRRRQRQLNALVWAAHGVLAGAVVAAGFTAAAWVSGTADASALWVALAAIPVAALLAALVGALLPISDLHVARALDRAAAGEDRFASALQLQAHTRRSRAQLVIDDALSRVRHVPAAMALPLQVPRSARWLPVPVLAIALFMLLGPQAQLQADVPAAPEISPDEWASLHSEFRQGLEQLPRPQTPEEEELFRKLQELADLLRQNPEKREALTEIARLSERVEQQRRALGSRENSMRNAARAISQSQSLKQLASMLRQGDYNRAATEMQSLSRQLKEGQLTPDASEFEAMAADLQKLAQQLGDLKELQQECQACAAAASAMNRQALAEALRRLAEQMQKDAENMRQCDNLGQCRSLLDELKRRMNQCGQCQGCGDKECSSCRGGSRPSAGKGGRRAGWGSANKWDGGSLTKNDEQRLPDVISPQERPGASTSFPIISPDERAQSGRSYEELYAEFAHKAEADLDLESVPVAYREYLRRYFNAIRPEESTAQEPGEPAPDR